MALDDPNITKVMFESINQTREVTADQNARLACVIKDRSDKWHVEIIDLAPGIFTIQPRLGRRGKPYFHVIPRKSFSPKKNKTPHVKGRYS